MRKFKFFSGKKSKIDWEQTGLLVDSFNVDLLINVLNKTYDYITNNNLYEPRYSMILIIMTKLFRNKLTDFSQNFIQYKIDEVMVMMRSPEISGYITDIQQNAWTGVDIEAEITQIIYERCNWDDAMKAGTKIYR
jgi:hypothetical protein